MKVFKTFFTSSKLVSIAKIGATVETKFAQRFNLEDFSTLNFFMNEQTIDFNRERTTKDILRSIKKMLSTDLCSHHKPLSIRQLYQGQPGSRVLFRKL